MSIPKADKSTEVCRMQQLEESAAFPFNFIHTVHAHGWVALQPFSWSTDRAELCRIHPLSSGKIVRIGIQARAEPADSQQISALQIDSVQVRVEGVDMLSAHEEAEIRQAVRRMLRLDEDLREFHQLCGSMPNYTPRLQHGAGRLLRCPTLFEDMVYTLCTTNIAWSGTKRMVERLTTKLGSVAPEQPTWNAFPTPAAIAGAGTEFLRQEIGLGYRSSYVWELAVAVASGQLDLKSLEDPNLPCDELYRALRQIKGVGDYAAASLLMLLGRYERLAIDSVTRAFVAKKYYNGNAVNDAQIQAIYAPWARWRYLAYWFDLIAEDAQ